MEEPGAKIVKYICGGKVIAGTGSVAVERRRLGYAASMARPKLAGVGRGFGEGEQGRRKSGDCSCLWRDRASTRPMKARTNTSRSARYDRDTPIFSRSRAMKSQ